MHQNLIRKEETMYHIIAVDNSGSMAGPRSDRIKLVVQGMLATAETFAIALCGSERPEVLSWTMLTTKNRTADIAKFLSHIDGRGGGLFDNNLANFLEETLHNAKQDGYKEVTISFFTDRDVAESWQGVLPETFSLIEDIQVRLSWQPFTFNLFMVDNPRTSRNFVTLANDVYEI
jgi:uncharacterized protein with von Willebrand factor type A (vWA) domain